MEEEDEKGFRRLRRDVVSVLDFWLVLELVEVVLERRRLAEGPGWARRRRVEFPRPWIGLRGGVVEFEVEIDC